MLGTRADFKLASTNAGWQHAEWLFATRLKRGKRNPYPCTKSATMLRLESHIPDVGSALGMQMFLPWPPRLRQTCDGDAFALAKLKPREASAPKLLWY